MIHSRINICNIEQNRYFTENFIFLNDLYIATQIRTVLYRFYSFHRRTRPKMRTFQIKLLPIAIGSFLVIQI